MKQIYLRNLNIFKKKYQFKIDLLSDEQLIIPEYKIELLNKSKKIINTIENIENIIDFKKQSKKEHKEKKETKSSKTETKKNKNKKVLRTLWVRRKKKTK